MATDLDRKAADRAAEVRELDALRVAMFSACCAERLYGLYEEFSKKANWGQPDGLRQALDLVWEQSGRVERDREALRAAISRIERQTPDADEFGDLEGTLAQDACICVDLALRAALGEAEVNPHAADYVLEALSVAESFLRTGLLDVGSGEEAERFAAVLWESPRIRRELQLQEEDLRDLTRAGVIDSASVATMRRRAQKSRWSLRELTAR